MFFKIIENNSLKKIVKLYSSKGNHTYKNMFPKEALKGNMSVFRNPQGTNLLQRGDDFFIWQNSIRNAGLWFFEKTSTTAPKTECNALSDSNNLSFAPL